MAIETTTFKLKAERLGAINDSAREAAGRKFPVQKGQYQ
jgi:hypothetical protein